MSRLRHVGAVALSAIRDAPFAHFASALAVGVSLWLMVTLGSALLGAQQLLDGWGGQLELTLYLHADVPEAEAQALAESAAELGEGSARYVSAEEAWGRLVETLGRSGQVLERLPDNPLPASIELAPAPPHDLARMEALAHALQRLPGVEEVDWGREWALRLARLSQVLRGLLWGVLPLLALGAAALVGSVVRLTVYLRREETELLRLLRTSEILLRFPFVLEGALAGLVGGVFAAGGLWWLGSWVLSLDGLFPKELGLERLASVGMALGVIGAGALLGTLASTFSVGRRHP